MAAHCCFWLFPLWSVMGRGTWFATYCFIPKLYFRSPLQIYRFALAGFISSCYNSMGFIGSLTYTIAARRWISTYPHGAALPALVIQLYVTFGPQSTPSTAWLHTSYPGALLHYVYELNLQKVDSINAHAISRNWHSPVETLLARLVPEPYGQPLAAYGSLPSLRLPLL